MTAPTPGKRRKKKNSRNGIRSHSQPGRWRAVDGRPAEGKFKSNYHNYPAEMRQNESAEAEVSRRGCTEELRSGYTRSLFEPNAHTSFSLHRKKGRVLNGEIHG